MWNTDKNLYPERALASLEMVAHGEYIDIVKCHIAVSFFLSFEYFSQAQEVGKGCALVPESSQNDQGARESASIIPAVACVHSSSSELSKCPLHW